MAKLRKNRMLLTCLISSIHRYTRSSSHFGINCTAVVAEIKVVQMVLTPSTERSANSLCVVRLQDDNNIPMTHHSIDHAGPNNREAGKFWVTLFDNCRSTVTPFGCTAAMSREGSTRAVTLPSFPIRDRRSRDAEVGSELRTFRIEQPGSIQALVLSSGSMEAKHQKGITSERFIFFI
ncbi:hypothetical protein T265_07837 [Opisthorchis viverrini]|uniref:Uncharacterized protein n=1 Tax=Opisthorchis viverrini TaxID=6198 RepID=A0A074ZB51_OPIVI|nr:hypothetical protein T265_07837 [Opisthorchis viverrini]KER24526.1 hypothetical protein T265_07837 [Opisthorchis viverrini]